MTDLVIQTLAGVLELIGDDPRHWAQGVWRGVRQNGALVAVGSWKAATCFCLGGAVTEVLNRRPPHHGRLTEVRTAVELHLLATLEAETGERFLSVYVYNDRNSTSYADVIRLVTHTLRRLRFERVAAWATADARGDADPRVLTGEFADLQDHYDDTYTQALVKRADAGELN